MKDFELWSSAKKAIHTMPTVTYCHEREIWWCALGINVRFEQDGTGKQFDRPVVIIRSFNKTVFFAVALTGRRKTGKYYFPVGMVSGQDASAILSQVRLLDTKRLIRKIGMVDEATFKVLKKELARVLLF